MADRRTCNRCNAKTTGVCRRCGCPEFTLVRDPQRLLPFASGKQKEKTRG